MAGTESTGRRQRAEESRSRIYEAALAIIAEKGFDEASIKEIVSRAGVSVGAFYHHFESKNAILEENFRLADERFAGLSQNPAPAADGEASGRGLVGATSAERIVEYFGRYGRFVETVTGLDLSRRIYVPTNKLFVKKGRAMQTVLIGMLAVAIDEGELETDLTAEAAAERLFIGARGVAFHWCLMDGSFVLETAMREYARRALRALEPLSP